MELHLPFSETVQDTISNHLFPNFQNLHYLMTLFYPYLPLKKLLLQFPQPWCLTLRLALLSQALSFNLYHPPFHTQLTLSFQTHLCLILYHHQNYFWKRVQWEDFKLLMLSPLLPILLLKILMQGIKIHEVMTAFLLILLGCVCIQLEFLHSRQHLILNRAT